MAGLPSPVGPCSHFSTIHVEFIIVLTAQHAGAIKSTANLEALSSSIAAQMHE